MIIKHISEIDTKEWDDFVYKHPLGNFFQTSLFFNLHIGFSNYEPIAYAVVKDNVIQGVLVGIIQSNYKWPIRNLTKRAIIIGGPLIETNSKEVFNFLILNILNKIENKCIYIQIRNIFDVTNYDFANFNFEFENHLDIIHDLSSDEKSIINKISKSKLANVRKSFNKGAIVREIENINEFNLGVDYIISTYNKIGLPCPEKSFFIKAFNNYSQSGFIKCFGAFFENKLIAIRIEICYKDTIYDWYTGSLSGFNNIYPNDILPYCILLYGKKNNFILFDFGGAGKPEKPYGVRDHKIKFGGTIVNYGRYEKVNNMFLMNIFKLGYKTKKIVDKVFLK